MKNNYGIFIFIVLGILSFSMGGCVNDNNTNGEPPTLEGSWHSAVWAETFTFNLKEKTFSKMSDEGWGERGDLAWTTKNFTCFIKEKTDDGLTWTHPAPEAQVLWERTYAFKNDKLIINGNNEYARKAVHFETKGAKPHRILSIGNSFSQDAMRYMLDILVKNGVSADNVLIVNAYIGGMDLQGHAGNAVSNSAAYIRQSFGFNGAMTTTSGVTLLSILTENDWDYITLQQASHHSGNPATYDPYVDDLIAFIKSNAANPDVKIGWHMTWAYAQNSTHTGFPYYGSDQMTMYNAIASAVQAKVAGKFDFIIPAGTAVQNARTTTLFSDNLCSDGYHLNDFGRFIAGAMWIKQIYGLNVDVFDSYQAMNKFNLTKNHITTIKKCVDDAFAKPFGVTNQ